MLVPMLLCLGAGLMTAVGGALGILVPQRNTKTMELALALGLGFSAGVMILISFMELLPTSETLLKDTHFLGMTGPGLTFSVFIIGILFCVIVDRITPKAFNPHEPSDLSKERGNMLRRVGVVTALAIALHNFPEGMATLVAAMEGSAIGFGVLIAVALHNLPEGLAVALPIFYATRSRTKAFLAALGAGLLEPLGAFVCLLVLGGDMNAATLGMIFAAIAGVMVFISFDELIPASREFGEHHWSIYGILSGIFVMGMSLILF